MIPPDPTENRKTPFNPTHFDYRFKVMQNWRDRAIGAKRKQFIENTLIDTRTEAAPSRSQRQVGWPARPFKGKLHRRFSARKLTPTKAGSSAKRTRGKTPTASKWEPHSRIGLDEINDLFYAKESLRDRASDQLSNQFRKNYMAIDLNQMRKDNRLSAKQSVLGRWREYE